MKRFFSLLCIFILLFCGCQSQNNDFDTSINLTITKDFGAETLFDSKVDINSDTSVMEVLVSNLEVETEYGGGFVNAINGVSSGYTKNSSKTKEDWFFYVNGIESSVGANDYILNGEETVLWDFHNWDNGTSIDILPAMVLNSNQTKDLEIVYSKEFKEQANKLKEHLSFSDKVAVNLIDIQNYDNFNLLDISSNTLLICNPKEAFEIKTINKIFKLKNKVGVFFDHLKEGSSNTSLAGLKKEFGSDCWLITLLPTSTKSFDELLTQISSGKFDNSPCVIFEYDEFISLPRKAEK